MKKWIKNGELLAEPVDKGQRFGVYRFDDGSFYLGEFDDYKRNGMGMQSLEDGDYFFGYFCNNETDYPYVHFSMEDDCLEIVFEKDYYTNTERYLKISLDNGEFFYGQRRDDVNIGFGFRLSYPDEDDPSLKDPWILLDYYGKDGESKTADDFIDVPTDVINKIFREPFSLIEPTPMFMAHPLKSLDGFEYRRKTNYHSYYMENSGSGEYGSGIGMFNFPNMYKNQDRFGVSEFLNGSMCGWQFEHAVDGSKRDRLIYENRNGKYFIFENNLGLGGGIEIIFPQNWSPAIKYETNGYLYIVQTESKGYPSYSGPGLRLDIKNGELCVVNFIERHKFTYQKYYHLELWCGSYWSKEGKKLFKKTETDHFTNYIEKYPEYYTIRHPFIEEPKEEITSMDTSDTSAKFSDLKFNSSTSSSASSSEKNSSSSSSGPEIISCFGRDLDLEIPEFVQDVELKNFPRGNKFTGYAYQGKPMIGWVTLHNGDMFYANFHNAKFDTPLRKNLGVFIHFTSKYDYRVYVFKDTDKWQYIDYDNVELTTNNVMGVLAPKEYENAAENGYFAWDSEESHTYLLTKSQRYGEGRDLGYFPHAFPDTNEQTLGELSFADMEEYHTQKYTNAVYFGEDKDTFQGGMGDMYVDKDGTILYGHLNSNSSGIHVRGYGYKLITGSFLQVGWLENDGKAYLDDYGVFINAEEGLWAGIFKNGNVDYSQDYLYIGTDGRVSYRANGKLFEANIGITSFEILCNELFAKRILESCLHKESEFIDRLVRNIDF